MGTLTSIKPHEMACIDHVPVAQFFGTYGAVCGECMIMTRVEKLSSCLHQLERYQRKAECAGIPELSARARVLADELGMVSLSQSLVHLGQTAAQQNIAALGAVWGRVTRIGDQSLVALWALPQLRL